MEGQVELTFSNNLVRLGAEAEVKEGLTFANFVEFDTLYGHPRDVAGYARALEWFDAGTYPYPFLRTTAAGGTLRSSRADHWKTTRPSGAPSTHPGACAGGGLGGGPARGGVARVCRCGGLGRGASEGWVPKGRGGVSCDYPPGALRPPDHQRIFVNRRTHGALRERIAEG